jgi:hypothetical protein
MQPSKYHASVQCVSVISQEEPDIKIDLTPAEIVLMFSYFWRA